MKVVLISYWPLLNYTKQQPTTAVEGLQTAAWLKTILPPDVYVRACLWTRDKNGHQPVLILERAQEIADHLLGWTVRQQSEWFDLIVTDNEVSYCVALFPRLKKSIDRWELNQSLYTGKQPSPEQRQYNIIFCPLAFNAPLSSTYQTIRGNISKQTSMYLGLLDSKEIAGRDPLTVDHEKIINLGEFRLYTNPKDASIDCSAWVEEYLKPPELPNAP